MCNHLNLKILIHIFTIFYLIMIIIIMRGENFVAHLDGLGGTSVCRGIPVAHHCSSRLLLALGPGVLCSPHVVHQFHLTTLSQPHSLYSAEWEDNYE
jgi:hypothetical protein